MSSPYHQDQDQGDEPVDQGLQLVHLLLACAEAVGCRDTHLTQSLLSQIWGSANPWGDSLHRVSHCFATGLQSRLSLLLHNVNANGTFANDASPATVDERIENHNGPALLTVVEQDANHNGPFFLGRFLEASLQRNSVQRVRMEKYHFAEEIKNIVAYEGSDRVERHERADQWPRQLGRAGFQAVGFVQVYESSEDDALGLRGRWVYSGLASEKGFLLLGWKGSPIMLASAWQVHPHTASSAGSSFVRVSVMSKN